MKLAFFDAKPYDKVDFDRCAKEAGLEIKYFEAKLNEDTVSLAEGFPCVCVFVNDVLTDRVIDQLYRMGVQMIALRCAGFNNVDIRACQGKLRVFRVPVYSPYAVAEHAMAMLLTINRRIHKAYIRTRDFNFSLNGLTGFDLHGKTVGIIGTGKIGRVFGDICRGFGMNILAYDKYPVDDPNLHYTDLPALFEKSHVISLHCPLTEDTRHIINEESIRQMRSGVVLINTSRGGLIDTEALINGLLLKKVGAACLDVYEEEGDIFYEDFSGHIVRDDKLIRLVTLPNVIITSHQAYLTEEALGNIAQVTVRNISQFFAGTPDPSTEVTYKVLDKS